PLFSQSYNAYSYVLNSPLSLVDPSGYEPAWWGAPIPTAAMCGNMPRASFQASVHISSSSGGFDGFLDAVGNMFEAIGDAISSLFGGGGSSGAAPTNKPAPYDPYGASSTFVPYSDIASRSLPSTTSAATGVPSV